MAVLRTRRSTLCVALEVGLWITLFLFLAGPDSVTALEQPREFENGTIEWGSLPPVPTSSNRTGKSRSRPSTLADMSEGFVDMVQPRGLPLSYITFAMENTIYNNTNYYADNWQTEMWKIMGLFVGIIVCFLFGLLYVLIVPIISLFFCCCRCCDNCGGKRVQRETKSMGCKRVTLTLFFFSITGIICAGMAFTNVSNEFIKVAVDEFKDMVDNSIGDLQSYFDATTRQIDYMVETEYAFVDDLLTYNLENIGDEIGGSVEDYLLAEAGLQEVMDSINNISNTFEQVANALEENEELRAELINQSAVLALELQEVADKLDTINKECSNCVDDVDKLTVSADFNKLPTLEVQITGVQEANETVVNITKEINDVLDNISVQITDMTNDTVETALKQLTDAEQQVNDSFADVKEVLSDLDSRLSTATSDLDSVWDDQVKVYSQYVYYSLIGLTCTVLLIVMFNLIGFTMGTCSYKDVPPTERSRMSNAGGNVLMAGVFFSFLFAPLLMLITCLLFSGLSVVTLTCDPLLTYEFFNETIDQPNVVMEGYFWGEVILGNSSIPLTFSGIMSKCDKDESAYNALMLQSLYDLESINEQLDQLEDEVTEIIDAINPEEMTYDFPFSTIISNLNNLQATTELSQINYTASEAVLSTNITGVDLTEYAIYLREEGQSQTNLADNLTAEATKLDQIQADIVDPMIDNMNQIQSNLDALQMLETQLDAQVSAAIAAIGVAEGQIASNATSEAIMNASLAYANRLLGYGEQFYVELEDQVTNEFGKCRLLSSAYAYSIQSTCDYSIASLNTLWFTVGWCVFFYIPSIFFAVRLAKYYRIMDEEAPYRAPKKSKKKKQKQQNRRRESDEEMPMDDMDGATGPDNIRLVDNGRPSSMMPQQNPHYVQDEPILAYNDLGRPMAPPPAYNPGEPFNIPPHDYYF